MLEPWLAALARHVSPLWSRLTPRLTVSDLAPNVGMWWYFFTEMFDHFRAFFLGVFQVGFAIDLH